MRISHQSQFEIFIFKCELLDLYKVPIQTLSDPISRDHKEFKRIKRIDLIFMTVFLFGVYSDDF